MRHLFAGLLVVFIFTGVSEGVHAQSAEAYFHRAAQAYIAEDFSRAKAQVAAGLRLDPSNRKLRALRRKLRQQRRRNQQGNKGFDANRPSGKEDNRKKSRAEEAENYRPPRDEPSTEKKGTPSDADPSRREPSQPPASSASKREAGPSSAEEPPREMSRARAERILQALERQEAQLLRQVRQREQPRRHVEKDW